MTQARGDEDAVGPVQEDRFRGREATPNIGTPQVQRCENPFCSNTTRFGYDRCEECRSDTLDLRPTNPTTFPRTPQTQQRTRHYKCGECGSEFDTLNGGACPLCGFDGEEDSPDEKDVEEYVRELDADEVARIILDMRGDDG
jgi:hypothetical protein